MRKVYFTGTHRVRRPDETLALITPLLTDYGITRLADVTGLDILGLPVVIASRPLARTLSVSQGKGADLVSAKVSAAMEAIELWHGESAVPEPVMRHAPADAMSLPYDLDALEQPERSVLTKRTPLDWIEATALRSQTPTVVPYDAVLLDTRGGQPWRPLTFLASSNGLASGNVRSEALLHALYEAIERDATSLLDGIAAANRDYLDPSSVDDPGCAILIENIERAGGWLEIVLAPGRWPVPVFACFLWLPDMAGTLVAGAGAHLDPAVALSRALTEAAQSRLTFITGSRDDIPARIYRRGDIADEPPPVQTTRTWHDMSAPYTRSFADTDAEVSWLTAAIEEVAGAEPLAVDLCERSEFAVVKVLCPGFRLDVIHEFARPEV